MKKILLAILVLMVAATAHAKGNAEKGKAKATQVCAACHGPDGAKPIAPDQPILAGPVSRQEMEDLAAWFSTQKSSLHFQR